MIYTVTMKIRLSMIHSPNCPSDNQVIGVYFLLSLKMFMVQQKRQKTTLLQTKELGAFNGIARVHIILY